MKNLKAKQQTAKDGDDMERNKNERNLYMQAYLQDDGNRERHKRSVYKSSAKRFVFEFATFQEMKELNELFNERQGV